MYITTRVRNTTGIRLLTLSETILKGWSNQVELRAERVMAMITMSESKKYEIVRNKRILAV